MLALTVVLFLSALLELLGARFELFVWFPGFKINLAETLINKVVLASGGVLIPYLHEKVALI